MPAPISAHVILALWLTVTVSLTLRAQDEPAGDEVVKMAAFNVTAYSGRIPIIDGFTGKESGLCSISFRFPKALVEYQSRRRA